jgi:drug/metabolite transporter (DMT)-like permease
MWGSTFLLTKLAVAELPPLVVVAGRLSIAAVILLGLALASGRRLLPSARHGTFFVLMALIGNCLPFSLITWGQQWIPSGLAGMLMASMPLVTLVLAHFFVSGERLNAAKVLGFFLGFAGVIVLLGPQRLLEFKLAGMELPAQLAILAGTLSYACAAIIARRRPESDSLAASAGVMSAASLIMVPVAFTFDSPWRTSPTGTALLAVLALGVMSTALATLVYFRLITRAGPGFLSLINYLIPLWASFLGAWLLDEQLGISAWLALALILTGMFVSQLRARHPVS